MSPKKTKKIVLNVKSSNNLEQVTFMVLENDYLLNWISYNFLFSLLIIVHKFFCNFREPNLKSLAHLSNKWRNQIIKRLNYNNFLRMANNESCDSSKNVENPKRAKTKADLNTPSRLISCFSFYHILFYWSFHWSQYQKRFTLFFDYFYTIFK